MQDNAPATGGHAGALDCDHPTQHSPHHTPHLASFGATDIARALPEVARHTSHRHQVVCMWLRGWVSESVSE